MDEYNVEFYGIYSLVRNQVRVAPMGEVIDLDYAAVLGIIKLYVDADKAKETFENVVRCFNIEKEFAK